MGLLLEWCILNIRRRTESDAVTAIHNWFPIGPDYRTVPSNAAGEFLLPSDEPQAESPECLASGEDLIDYENEMRDKAAKESVEQPDPFVLDRDECTKASFEKAAQRVQIGWRMVAPSGVADPPGIALDQPEPVYRESSNPDDRIRELEAALAQNEVRERAATEISLSLFGFQAEKWESTCRLRLRRMHSLAGPGQVP